MRVLFLVPYPVGEAPSQRFRFEQYFTVMQEKGIQLDVSSFLDEKAWKILYEKGKVLLKISAIIKGLLRRLRDVFRSVKYNYIFIHREAAPLGPPFFEWLIAKVFSGKIIYDFDDAIWLPNVSESNKLFSKIKWHHKVKSICEWAHLVSCGNDFLKDFALQYNKNVVVNPTVVDSNLHYNRIKKHNPGRTIIGWTGSHSTGRYLKDLLPVLKKIEKENNVEVRIIADAQPELDLKSLKFVSWNKTSEIDDLLAFDIGIMPLRDDEWSRGKCGFKLIQYLSLGIPAIASPVGVNRKIIEDGWNGFLCGTQDEWIAALQNLIANPLRREQFGEKGRQRIISHFSTVANSPLFLSMFA